MPKGQREGEWQKEGREMVGELCGIKDQVLFQSDLFHLTDVLFIYLFSYFQ